MSARFATFREFYPYYLSEHRNATCRKLHFAFEKNRPATFKYPGYSFVGDWVMYWQLLTGKISFEERDSRAGQGTDSA